MSAILSDELRSRAEAAIERIQSKKEAQNEAMQAQKEAKKELAIKEFRQKFEQACPSLVASLPFTYKATATTSGSWQIETAGQYCNCFSYVKVKARLELKVADTFLEVYCHSASSDNWSIVYPDLNVSQASWVQKEIPGRIDEASLEETILIALYEYDELLPKYHQALQTLKDDANRRIEQQRLKLEQEQRRSEENKIIQELLSQEFSSYSYSSEGEWGDSQIIIYKVRYCCGVAKDEDEIDFDYEEIYSLSYPKEENGKFYVVPVEGDRLILDKGEHKPVVSELTLDSYPSAKKKLGRIGFIKGGIAITVEGAIRYSIEDAFGGCDYYWRFDNKGSEEIVLNDWQMCPWLREALGLQPLAKRVVNIVDYS